MKKQLMLATSVLVLAAGSLFAFSDKDNAKESSNAATETCPPDCCTGEECCAQ